MSDRRENLRQQIKDYNSTKAKTNRQKERIAELEEGNRLAVAEAYRCGFEAGKAVWLNLCKEQSDELANIKEKARAAVSAPYGRALRELKEALPPP